ncbi:MAG: hypothetical protein HZC01_00605 [Candidatus Kerfeldbacteria bacterium]|nr:hypothetical protein [Candidatus Kerfeldbacteria bacterium]
MKRLCLILGIGVWAALTILYFVGLSNDFGAPIKPVTFGQIMDDRPTSLYYSTRNFSDGVVVYVYQRDNRSVLVVAHLPLPELEAGKLSEEDVIAVVVDNEQYAKVKIGSVISVYGSVTCQDTDTGRLYYMIGQSVTVTGVMLIDNPDFAMIAAAAIDAANDFPLGAFCFLSLLL